MNMFASRTIVNKTSSYFTCSRLRCKASVAPGSASAATIHDTCTLYLNPFRPFHMFKTQTTRLLFTTPSIPMRPFSSFMVQPNNTSNNSSSSSRKKSPLSGSSTFLPSHEVETLALSQFRQCTTPQQLERAIEHFVEHHPDPSEMAILEMLGACSRLAKSAAKPTVSATTPVWARKDVKNKSSLLDTILTSNGYSTSQVFEIAQWIYNIHIGKAQYNSRGTKGEVKETFQLPVSVAVLNDFLQVCAETGELKPVVQVLDLLGGIKSGSSGMNLRALPLEPDLSTFRYLIQACASSSSKTASDEAIKAIDLATAYFARQAKRSLLFKIGVCTLVGATVGKFTMMGVLALPAEWVTFDLEPTTVEASRSEGVLKSMVSHQLALGVGTLSGLLASGFFALGDAVKVRNTSQGNVTNSSQMELLPRLQLMQYKFPALVTTNEGEIKNYFEGQYRRILQQQEQIKNH